MDNCGYDARPADRGCDAGVTGYLVEVACPRGVTFGRWVALQEAAVDLPPRIFSSPRWRPHA